MEILPLQISNTSTPVYEFDHVVEMNFFALIEEDL